MKEYSGKEVIIVFKKITSFLVAFVCSFSTCKALQLEVLDGDFSYIVETSTNTAMVRNIYIKAGENKDIYVPSEIIDGCKQKYKVNEISPDAVKDVIKQIKSIELPGTLEYTNSNIETLKCLFLYHVPVKRTTTSVMDFFCIKETFMSTLFPGVI